MYLLYTLALTLYVVTALPVFWYARRRRGKSWGRLGDRVGRIPRIVNPGRRPSVWIHAVSVGEVLAARSLLDELRSVYPHHQLVLSTTTTTGQQVARGLGEAVDGVFYAPVDVPWCLESVLSRVTPQLVVFVDTEIWPNWLHACRRRGVKTIIVNGRISDRSFRRYRWVRRFMRRVLGEVDLVCAQTDEWGRRFVELGLPRERLRVTGSLKFDAVDAPRTPSGPRAVDRVVRDFAFTTGHPTLIAASTMRGEEDAVLDAFEGAVKARPDAVLILAPRHPERATGLLRLVTTRGFSVVLRSALEPDAPVTAQVVVLDTVGELARLFPLATLVFVGGSLVPTGGHNILEPAVCGKPILFGPDMSNFRDIAELFSRHDAAVPVRSATELTTEVVALLDDAGRRDRLGAAAQAVVEANRGARDETMTAIVGLLPPERSPRGEEVPALGAVPPC